MRDLRLPLPSLDRWPRLQRGARHLSYAFGQLLERRVWLFGVADALVVLNGLVAAAISGARLEDVFAKSVLLPSFVLGVPTLAGVVALERRSGTLDLALAVPSTERFFLRRVLPVLALLALQSVFLLTACTLENAGGVLAVFSRGTLFAVYVRAVVQTFLVLAFLGAAALFWAVRVRTSGAVAVAAALTSIAFWPWLSSSPYTAGLFAAPERLLGITLPSLAWVGSALVVALAATILYLYARERLRRPETMLT